MSDHDLNVTHTNTAALNDSLLYYDDTYGENVSPLLFNAARYLTTYFQPILCVFGLIGNLLSFVIFVSKNMRKISSNIYLAALSGSSYGFNLVLILQWMEMVKVPLMNKPGLCQIIVYLGYVFGFLSVWMIVCITVENYIVTFHLSKASVYCSVIRARIVVGVLTISSVLLYSGHFWTTGVVDYGNGVVLCTEVERFAFINRIYHFWDTLTTIVLPTIITTCLIIAILSRNLCIHMTSVDVTLIRRLSKKQRSLIRITRVLLAISLTFVILSAPSHVNRLRHVIITETYGRQMYTLQDRVIQQLFLLIFYFSFCLNNVYYLAWSINFRKEFRRLFGFHKQPVNRDIEINNLNGNQNIGGAEKFTNNHTEKITLL